MYWSYTCTYKGCYGWGAWTYALIASYLIIIYPKYVYRARKMLNACWEAHAAYFLAYWTPFPVIVDPLLKFYYFLFPEYLVPCIQIFLGTMPLGILLHQIPNILSLSILFNWEGLYSLYSSQSGLLFNLSQVLLPVSVTQGARSTLSIACSIFQGSVNDI